MVVKTMEEKSQGPNTEGHQLIPEKRGIGDSQCSEDYPFKRQKVVTQRVRGKWGKKEEVVSCVEERAQRCPVDLAITEWFTLLEQFQLIRMTRSQVLNVEGSQRMRERARCPPFVPPDPCSTLCHSAPCPRSMATSIEYC